MKIRRKVTILAVLAVLVVSLIVAAQPVSACRAGCTPGFWKLEKHFGFWTGYSPNQTVGSVFTNAPPELADDTLLEALDYGGGPGYEGAARILLRAAAATLLTSAYDAAHGGDWWYNWWTEDLIKDRVYEALASGDRDAMLGLAKRLDDLNNLGCPL